jgi:hypothetical protein
MESDTTGQPSVLNTTLDDTISLLKAEIESLKKRIGKCEKRLLIVPGKRRVHLGWGDNWDYLTGDSSDYKSSDDKSDDDKSSNSSI